MLANIYLLQYNNYYNRMVKRQNTLEEYLKNSTLLHTLRGTNFNQNDGVDTVHILNYDGDIPNYLIVFDNSNNIISRWFVIDELRIREGQNQFILHRDLAADFYDDLLYSDTFIEKATLQPGNPLIFNSENMTYNQILSKVDTLEDETHCAWLVGYFTKKRENSPGSENTDGFDGIIDVRASYNSDFVPDITVDSEDKLPFAQYLNKNWYTISNVKFDIYVKFGNSTNAGVFSFCYNPGDEELNETSIDTLTPLKQVKVADGNTYLNPSKYTTFNRSSEIAPDTYSLADRDKYYLVPVVYDTNNYVNNQGRINDCQKYVNQSNASNLNMALVNGQIPDSRYLEGFRQSFMNSISSNNLKSIARYIEMSVADLSPGLNEWANKVVKIGDNYYRVKYSLNNLDSRTGNNFRWDYYLQGSNTGAGAEIDNILTYAVDYYNNFYGYELASVTKSLLGSAVDFRVSCSQYETLTLEPLTTAEFIVSVKTDSDNMKLMDAPYDMFCMPYPTENTQLRIKYQYTNGDDIVTEERTFGPSSKYVSFAIANAIASKYSGSGALYDIQLLPYCPVRQYLTKDSNQNIIENSLDLTQISTNPANQVPYYRILNADDSTTAGLFIYCNRSSDTFDINYSIPITELKVQSECDMYRLCSPNDTSIFEFNAAKNYGVEHFNVDYSYKPYVPYIHLNPNFKIRGLYGSDFDTPRGLVCGGDFSLAVINDQWETFQLQNKNYQLSFQRQIENMEVQHEVGRIQDIVTGITGTIQGAATGATGGSFIGGGPGAAIGGIIGGLTSGIAGAIDYKLNEKLRNEALDYTKDMFGYQLGNIQALPVTLSKVTAFNPNNKIYPVLEYYTCSDVEKEALRNKIKYNGMTVMAIGKVYDYIGSGELQYIKGKLIRSTEVDNEKTNYHILSSLAEELNKGLYF